ncbi:MULTISPECIES: hypothetical protein [Brevibacillus]|jgi:hypothetical protein|uniref:Glutamine amidotransferase domain-containing protein n=1 Tax=Brevibacillus parabrevis TaxID=54914 RepID=A0A4Y3PGM3_BREPA|nr:MULTISPECIES: hypothetical protein [Brevibacillus]MBU8713351.1 hypothetical protein [Brevibacillus parabrevis]MDH6351678.1 hypothetical protein [Brevibacillus sp. 1238]MDR4997547.1 hypothetical protein [Brevibacillus parabrevis]MED2255848.1 hypothetical protein [Brevibacillus parabrevis]NRQ55220.1 hypothetical protein [Brevibacillus sp. HD1.4A]
MRKIAALYGGSSQHFRSLNEPKYRKYYDRLIYLPDLENTSLDEFDALVVPSQLHMGLVMKSREKIKQFAEKGGIVVAFGPQPREWIPGQNWELRPTNFWWWLDKNAKSGLVLQKPDYDLFSYITLADATWHQHGVYWPPEGAEVLISTEDGGAVLYVDKVSTAGTWIVTTLDPDFHFGSYFMPATERFLDGFLPWLAEGNV